jgi:hypothetical protein
MKLYFAGGENKSWLSAIIEAKGDLSLYSYYYLCKDDNNNKRVTEFMKLAKESQREIMIDSGGYTARMKGVPIDVKKYSEFLNINKIEIAFELDTNSKKETLYNREYLIKNTNTKIIPIYHLGDLENGDKKYLYDMLDKFDFISIGGVAGEKKGRVKEKILYDFIFSNTKDKWKVHGLGITGKSALMNYPFYSVDSTSWLGGSMRGEVLSFENGSLKITPTSSIKAKEKSTYKTISFNDEKGEKKWFKRVVNNAKEFMKFEKYITKLWEKKGITWDL